MSRLDRLAPSLSAGMLPGVALALALGLPLGVASADRAFAQAAWVNGQPVFESDRARERQRLEAERQSRRSRYVYPENMTGGAKPSISPEAPGIVSLAKPEPAGVIIIDTKNRRLYYTLADNQAYVYPISVGRQGFTWTGTETISRVASWPTWTPPPEMRQRQPYLPKTMSGGINNPLGAKALYLGSSLYRIHGTNDPKSIGRASSSGCFRMMNKHVMHLASVAGIGTEVRVVRSYTGPATAASASSVVQ